MRYALPDHPPQSVIDRDESDLAPLADDTRVEFDGEWTTWGELMLADRHMVRRDTDGVLRGGYPL